MRSRRPCWLLPLTLLIAFSTGCSYVHFGRPERFRTDAGLKAENADLRVEKKLLQQELAIARKEGEALRTAIDQPQQGADVLVSQLNEATRELAELRVSYARLQVERIRLQSGGTGPSDSAADVVAVDRIGGLDTQLSVAEERLATTLRTFTALQEENSGLRASIDQVRAENATLTTRVEHLTAQNSETRSALAQLSTELLAQKEARAQAEQRSEALRAQVLAMVQPAPADTALSLASARQPSAPGAREIEVPHPAPPFGHVSSAGTMLSVDTGRLRTSPPEAKPVASPPTQPVRTYVVQAGDSLEEIARKFYGRPDRWNLLYAANSALFSGEKSLQPGMELEIPEE